jgi:predicted small secreted protein
MMQTFSVLIALLHLTDHTCLDLVWLTSPVLLLYRTEVVRISINRASSSNQLVSQLDPTAEKVKHCHHQIPLDHLEPIERKPVGMKHSVLVTISLLVLASVVAARWVGKHCNTNTCPGNCVEDERYGFRCDCSKICVGEDYWMREEVKNFCGSDRKTYK